MKTTPKAAPKLSLKKNVITRFTSVPQAQQGKATETSFTSLDTWTSVY